MYRPCLLAFVLAPWFAAAQPTHTITDAPQIGTTFQLYSGTWSAQHATGANASWDYSNAGASGPATGTFVDALTAPHSSTFPNATLCLVSGLTRNYMSVEPDGLYEHGNTGFAVVNEFEAPFKQIPYPLAMGTNWTASFDGVGAGISFNGDVEAQVVGFGTLSLPWGDVQNVLKIKMGIQSSYWGDPIEWRTDSVDVYYKSGFPWYLARATKRFRLLDGVIQPMQYGLVYASEASVVGLAEFGLGDAGMDVFPNPSDGPVIINATLAGPEAWVEVVDASGRVVHTEGSRAGGPGIMQWTVDAAEWLPGLYLVRVHDISGLAGQRKLVVH